MSARKLQAAHERYRVAWDKYVELCIKEFPVGTTVTWVTSSATGEHTQRGTVESVHLWAIFARNHKTHNLIRIDMEDIIHRKLTAERQ